MFVQENSGSVVSEKEASVPWYLLSNINKFADSRKELLVPPVCNTMMCNDGPVKIMIVGGPNIRNDYHYNEGEELFYQLKGDMLLNIMECGVRRSIPIREGEMFILPGKILHSPQRYENTIGLVLERQRAPSEKDAIVFFTDDSNQELLWQHETHITDLGKQVRSAIEAFYNSVEYKTKCPSSGPENTIANKSWVADCTTTCPQPIYIPSYISAIRKACVEQSENCSLKQSLLISQPPIQGREFECWLLFEKGVLDPAVNLDQCYVGEQSKSLDASSSSSTLSISLIQKLRNVKAILFLLISGKVRIEWAKHSISSNRIPNSTQRKKYEQIMDKSTDILYLDNSEIETIVCDSEDTILAAITLASGC